MGEEAPGEEGGVSGQLCTKYNITCVCGKVFFSIIDENKGEWR